MGPRLLGENHQQEGTFWNVAAPRLTWALPSGRRKAPNAKGLSSRQQWCPRQLLGRHGPRSPPVGPPENDHKPQEFPSMQPAAYGSRRTVLLPVRARGLFQTL